MASKTDPELVRAVLAYKQKRAEVKAKQRAELEDALKPWAQDVGREINRARTVNGASIQDIADIIGIQNRTFIYNMINAVPKGDTPEPRQDAALFGPPVTETIEFENAQGWTIDYFDNVATVKFPGDDFEFYDIVVVDGTPDLPDEWAEHSRERRAMYKDIAKAIRDHYRG